MLSTMNIFVRSSHEDADRGIRATEAHPLSWDDPREYGDPLSPVDLLQGLGRASANDSDPEDETIEEDWDDEEDDLDDEDEENWNNEADDWDEDDEEDDWEDDEDDWDDEEDDWDEDDEEDDEDDWDEEEDDWDEDNDD